MPELPMFLPSDLHRTMCHIKHEREGKKNNPSRLQTHRWQVISYEALTQKVVKEVTVTYL